MTFFELILARVAIYLLAYLLAVVVGHLVVRDLILKRHQPDDAGGLERGGACIGRLERVLTLTFVLVGQYEALALILTAKSIARFRELRNRDFAEYYLIGTLSSVLFAVLIGVLASWLVSLL